MSVTSDEFRRALGNFASGVTVVTSATAEGRPLGVTVASFASLSLDPPLVLICLDNRISMCEHLRQADRFAVNILAEDQAHVSNQFASRVDDRFAGVDHRPGVTGSPVLTAALASIECRVVERCPGGDHTIFLGHVEATEVRDERPLIYFRSRYGRLADETGSA